MLELNIGKRIIHTQNKAFVMGILNVTPDSFFDKSRGGVSKAMELIENGADILDIGGESTRPGFTEISAEEEINRIIPVLREIRKNSDIPVSVDTRKSQVFKAAMENGADFLNDVSSLSYDPEMAVSVSEWKSAVVLMDSGSEKNKAENPEMPAIEKTKAYLLERAAFAEKKGISKDRIILDPGIGFGKTDEENLEIIKNLDQLCKIGFPVLMALSRKRCIGYMTGKGTAEERLYGTLAADLISVMKGASILRVHDVKETLDTLNVMKYLC